MFLFFIDITDIVLRFRQIRFEYFIVLFFLQIVSMILINFQWWSINCWLKLDQVFSVIVEMNMLGNLVEVITPAVKAGGEVTKVVWLAKNNHLKAGVATAYVGTQKIISLAGFLCLNFISTLFFLIGNYRVINHWLLIISLLLLIILFLLVLYLFLYPGQIKKGIIRFKRWKNNNKIEDFFLQLEETVKQLKSHYCYLIYQLILSIVIWLLFAVKLAYLCSVFDLNLPFFVIAMMTYITYLIGMIPMLPGGIGTFEASLILFLTSFGASTDIVFAIALLFRLATYWLVFFISISYLFMKGFYTWLLRKKFQTL